MFLTLGEASKKKTNLTLLISYNRNSLQLYTHHWSLKVRVITKIIITVFRTRSENSRDTQISTYPLFSTALQKIQQTPHFARCFKPPCQCQAYPGLGCPKPHLGQAGEQAAVEYKIQTVSSVPAGRIQENKFLCYINPFMVLPMCAGTPNLKNLFLKAEGFCPQHTSLSLPPGSPGPIFPALSSQALQAAEAISPRLPGQEDKRLQARHVSLHEQQSEHVLSWVGDVEGWNGCLILSFVNDFHPERKYKLCYKTAPNELQMKSPLAQIPTDFGGCFERAQRMRVW